MAAKTWLILTLILVFLGAGVFYFWRHYYQPSKNNKNIAPIRQIILEGVAFEVETAATAEERAKGLSGRTSLCEQCGMVFIFPQKGYHAFWMKNTLIPLDIIWFNEKWQVVDYLAWAQPQGTRETKELPVYRPKERAKFVLEISAGSTKRIENFDIGSQAQVIKN